MLIIFLIQFYFILLITAAKSSSLLEDTKSDLSTHVSPILTVNYNSTFYRQLTLKIKLNYLDLSVNVTLSLKCLGSKPQEWKYPKLNNPLMKFWLPIVPGIVINEFYDNKTGKYESYLNISRLTFRNTGLYQCCNIPSLRTSNSLIDKQTSSYTCASLYIYANDLQHLIAPYKEQMPGNSAYITLIYKSPYFIPCKATFSDANVTLTCANKIFNSFDLLFDRTRGFLIKYPGMRFRTEFICTVSYKNVTQSQTFIVVYKGPTQPPKPKIILSTEDDKIPLGVTLFMSCSVTINADDIVNFAWKIGLMDLKTFFKNSDKHFEIWSPQESKTFNNVKGMIKKNVTSMVKFSNTISVYQNNYTCLVKDHTGKTGNVSKFLNFYDPTKKYPQILNYILELNFTKNVRSKSRQSIESFSDFDKLLLSSKDSHTDKQTIKIGPKIFEFSKMSRLNPASVTIGSSRPLTEIGYICKYMAYPNPGTITWLMQDFECLSPHIMRQLAADEDNQKSNNSISVKEEDFSLKHFTLKYCNLAMDEIAVGPKELTSSLKAYKLIENKEIQLSNNLYMRQSIIRLKPIFKGTLIVRINTSLGMVESKLKIHHNGEEVMKTIKWSKRKITFKKHVWWLTFLILSSIVVAIFLIFDSWKSKKLLKKRLARFGLNYDTEEKVKDNNNKNVVRTFHIPSKDLENEITCEFDGFLEFPKERLILGDILGEGAYGKVISAQAIGLTPDIPKTKVAIKMVRNWNEVGQLKSLITEFRIMTKMGKHLNLVNLLGVCSQDIERDHEFFVIMEYCAHGNLKNYLRTKRNSFQRYLRKEGFTSTNDISDLFDSSNSTFSNYLQLNDSGNRSNSDEVELIGCKSLKVELDDCPYTCRTTFSKFDVSTLLCYAYQIAKGMEYLESKKCIHRDLACRNILVHHNNIIKICDFGLSKNIYRYANYVKSSNATPVPIKWMAIESLLDNIYNHQTDVWSYGIVLWEIFSLGCTPYPGIDVGQEFVQKLIHGLRLNRPSYCSQDLFMLMTNCWETLPIKRPSFHKIAEKLSNFIEKTKNKSNDDIANNGDAPNDYYYYCQLLAEHEEGETTTFEEMLKTEVNLKSKNYNNITRLDSALYGCGTTDTEETSDQSNLYKIYSSPFSLTDGRRHSDKNTQIDRRDDKKPNSRSPPNVKKTISLQSSTDSACYSD